MQLSARCMILFFLSSGCSCYLNLQRSKWSDEINRNALKCLKTLVAMTDWAGNDFTVIFDDLDMIEFDLFKRHTNFTWKFINSKNNSSTLSHFSNVILFASSFASLKETTSRVNIRPMDTRSKYVIIVMENFEDFNDIRKSSTAIGPAMWKLDKTRVLHLVPHQEDVIAMTYFPFAKDCAPGELEILDVCRESGFQKGVELFPEKMLDIRGCVQNQIGVFGPRSVLHGRKEVSETKELRVGGVGGKLLEIVAEKMNMKLRLLPKEIENWESMLDVIASGEVLFSVGASVPSTRQLKISDFGSEYMQESFGFGYLAESYEVSWKNLVWPLSKRVWLYTGYTFILFCGLVLLTNWVHRRMMIDSVELPVLDIFGAFLGTSRAWPRSICGRYLFGIWVSYSYLITAFYNCGLVSFLTTPNEKRGIDTLVDLLEDGMDFGGTSLHKECYNDPSDPVMIKIYNKFEVWPADEAIRIVDNKQGASGFLTSSLSSYSRNHTDFNEHIHLLKEKTFSYVVPISMRRGSPFTTGVRRYAARAIQGGLNNYWLDYYIRETRLAEIDQKTPTPISMRHVQGIFIFYTSALIFSSLILLGEITFDKYISIFHFPLFLSSK